MYFGNNQPRTPNGATDLLSNDPPPSSSFPPHLGTIYDDDEDNEPELPPRSPMSSRHGDNSEIFKRLDSFEAKLESELDDLEALGVVRPDPDGKGERPISSSPSTVTTASSSSSSSSKSSKRSSKNTNNNIVIQAAYNAANTILEKGKGKSGKKLTKLSHKTNKIMNDYQAYLAEIQLGYPLSFDSMSSSNHSSSSAEEDTKLVASMQEDLENPVLTNIAQVREDVKDSYLERQEQKLERAKYDPDAKVAGSTIVLDSSGSSNQEDGRYATGEGQPLYRVWSDSTPTTTGSSASTSHRSSFSSADADDSSHGYEYATVFGESLLANSSRKRRYQNKNSILPKRLRSRRVQRGLLTIVVVAIVIGISIGVATIKKQESLPDWEGEYEAEIEKKAEEQQAEQEDLLEAAKLKSKLEMEEEIKMQPPKKLPLPSSSLPLKENDDTEEFEFRNKLAQMEKEKEEGEKQMMKEHSKADAAAAAEAIVEDVIQEAKPEQKEEDEESTTAASSVQETAGNSDTSNIDKEEEEEEAEEMGLGEELHMDLYYNAVVKYRPTMYDRTKGWTGSTYVEALVFCDSQGGLAVCPYDAICPDGRDDEPLGGYRDGVHSDWAWVPIVDDFNEWVQVGAREKCIKYTDRNGQKPVWGTSLVVNDDGRSSEELTQNVMCCLNVM